MLENFVLADWNMLVALILTEHYIASVVFVIIEYFVAYIKQVTVQKILMKNFDEFNKSINLFRELQEFSAIF